MRQTKRWGTNEPKHISTGCRKCHGEILNLYVFGMEQKFWLSWSTTALDEVVIVQLSVPGRRTSVNSARLGVNCDVHDGHTLESREHWWSFWQVIVFIRIPWTKALQSGFIQNLPCGLSQEVGNFFVKHIEEHQQRRFLAMRYVRLSYWTNALSKVTAKPLSPERIIEEAADHWASTPLCCK